MSIYNITQFYTQKAGNCIFLPLDFKISRRIVTATSIATAAYSISGVRLQLNLLKPLPQGPQLSTVCTNLVQTTLNVVRMPKHSHRRLATRFRVFSMSRYNELEQNAVKQASFQLQQRFKKIEVTKSGQTVHKIKCKTYCCDVCVLVFRYHQVFNSFPLFQTKGKRYPPSNAKGEKSGDAGSPSRGEINCIHWCTLQDIATNRIRPSHRPTTHNYHPEKALHRTWNDRNGTERGRPPSVQPHQ